MTRVTNREGQISCRTSQGSEISAGLIRFVPNLVVFEIYTPSVVMRVSEVLADFKILFDGRTAYSGRAVVRGMVNAGTTLLCEAALEGNWLDVSCVADVDLARNIQTRFEQFLVGWQKNYRILPEFKGAISDLQTFMAELQCWLGHVEQGMRSAHGADYASLERAIVHDLASSAVPVIDAMIEKFEAIAERLTEEERPSHRSFFRRQLHPLVLCSPFAYRTFYKPLGYAGDYESVNMILREPCEGDSLFGKLLNVWLLGQVPAQAHRNRIRMLSQRLCDEMVRVSSERRIARIYSLGCGAAHEVQQFLANYDFCEQAEFTLVDFDEETIQYLGRLLGEIKRRHRRNTLVHPVRKSVAQLLKEAGKIAPRSANEQFDLIYCAGLFDYLTDQVCKRLMNVFYQWLAPGGLLIVTNVDATLNDSRPFRHSLDFFLDWNLLYRTAKQLRSLAPTDVSPDDCVVLAEDSGMNVFLEVRKRKHA